jgi:hypothetical protein
MKKYFIAFKKLNVKNFNLENMIFISTKNIIDLMLINPVSLLTPNNFLERERERMTPSILH